MKRASGTIHVFTFKEGVFSSVAHDLRLRLDSFDIQLDGESVTATLDLKSLAVEGPVENGVVQASRYDAARRAEVETSMHRDVLRTKEFPVARFTGTAAPQGSVLRVQGELELTGQRASLAFEVREQGGTYRGEIELQPSRWGIAQYKALLGAIRLKDRVRVELELQEDPHV